LLLQREQKIQAERNKITLQLEKTYINVEQIEFTKQYLGSPAKPSQIKMKERFRPNGKKIENHKHKIFLKLIDIGIWFGQIR
jgi:hypothetical protein